MRFTSSSELPRSCSTTYLVGRTSLGIAEDRVSARAHSAGVTLLKAFHGAQAGRLPLPAKHDVVSHPVSALKTDSACAIAVASIYRIFPVLIATTRLSQPSLRAKLTASTTTSVSTVLMPIFCLPCLTPTVACNIILVSASSCVHGVTPR